PYLQVVLGWSALAATAGLMPLALLMTAASGLAPRVSARLGIRATMAAGLLLAVAGLVLMASLVDVEGGYLDLVPGLVVLGIGSGLAMTPSTEAVTGALPTEQQGVASAINDLTRELGAALGVALLGGLLTAGYRSSVGPALDALPRDLASAAEEGLANAAVAAQDAGAQGDLLMDAAAAAFVSGWQRSMWVGAVVTAVLLVVVLRIVPRVAVRPSDRTTDDRTTDDRT